MAVYSYSLVSHPVVSLYRDSPFSGGLLWSLQEALDERDSQRLKPRRSGALCGAGSAFAEATLTFPVVYCIYSDNQCPLILLCVISPV